jgi:hypothetical protein
MNNSPQFKFECEVRYWIGYAKKNGMREWNYAKDRLIKRRGKESVDKLTQEMNRQK